jgi:DNA-binding winged helix-turn-helix (wHTH) protein
MSLQNVTDDNLLALAQSDRDVAPVRREPLRARIPIQVAEPNSEVEVGGKPVEGSHLTKKERELLEMLGSRNGACLSKSQLLDALYVGRDEPELKIIDVFVCKLRSKLGPAKAAIQTIWGRGYAFNTVDFAWVPGEGRSGISLGAETVELLQTVASEADRKPEELAEELLLSGLKTFRKMLWEA